MISEKKHRIIVSKAVSKWQGYCKAKDLEIVKLRGVVLMGIEWFGLNPSGIQSCDFLKKAKEVLSSGPKGE